MAALKKLSSNDLRLAKKAGFGRKKPKKPKRSAGVSAKESYIARWNEYVDAAKEKIKEQKKIAALNKQIHGH